jgi:hypothetical protein
MSPHRSGDRADRAERPADPEPARSGEPDAPGSGTRRRVRGPVRRDRNNGGTRRPHGPPGRREAQDSPPRPTVTERLAVVDRLLDGSVPAAGAVWSRATAWILRIALEQSVDDLWSRTEPALARCPMRAQLLALRVIAGPPTAARTAALWTALSHAAHHHDHELAPGVGELRRWREDTERIVAELAAVCR